MGLELEGDIGVERRQQGLVIPPEEEVHREVGIAPWVAELRKEKGVVAVHRRVDKERLLVEDKVKRQEEHRAKQLEVHKVRLQEVGRARMLGGHRVMRQKVGKEKKLAESIGVQGVDKLHILAEEEEVAVEAHIVQEEEHIVQEVEHRRLEHREVVLEAEHCIAEGSGSCPDTL